MFVVFLLFLVFLGVGEVLVVAGVMQVIGARFVTLGFGNLLILPWRGRDQRIKRPYKFWWYYIWIDRPGSRARSLLLHLVQPAFVLIASAAWFIGLTATGKNQAATGVAIAGLVYLASLTWTRRKLVRGTFTHLSTRAIVRGRTDSGPIAATSVPVLRQARALELVGRSHDAYRVLAAEVEQQPRDIGLRMQCATSAGNAGLDDEAERHYRELLEMPGLTRAQHAAAANGLAFALLRPGHLGRPGNARAREALNLARTAREESPGSAAIDQTYAAALCRAGKFEEALVVARKLAREVPADTSGEVGVVLAWALAGVGRGDEAKSTWTSWHADRSSLRQIAGPQVFPHAPANSG